MTSTETTHKPSKTIIPTAPLPDPIAQTIDAVIALHTQSEKSLSSHQRIVESITAFFSRPVFLYCTLLVLALWIIPNLVSPRFGLPQFDPPPFQWLDVLLGGGSFLMTIGVLIAQKRQEKLSEQRAQLSLQLNLLSEQKIAKIIALLEELREDLPNVRNRLDHEAEVMKQAADPEAVITALEETLISELADLQQEAKENVN
ncbi:DUF1003 domain-containing protein [Phormidesmis sp. 146-35]